MAMTLIMKEADSLCKYWKQLYSCQQMSTKLTWVKKKWRRNTTERYSKMYIKIRWSEMKIARFRQKGWCLYCNSLCYCGVFTGDCCCDLAVFNKTELNLLLFYVVMLMLSSAFRSKHKDQTMYWISYDETHSTNSTCHYILFFNMGVN